MMFLIFVWMTLFTSNVSLSQTELESKLKPSITHHVKVRTNLGSFTLSLYGKEAPLTVTNFVALCMNGKYNEICFHRIIPGVLIQAGDPSTRWEVNMRKWGYRGMSIYGDNSRSKFIDELDTNSRSYKIGYEKGILAMANSGPNTNESQFFICIEPLSLPKKYTIFGEVSEGWETVKRISTVKLRDTFSFPDKSVIIDSVEVKTLYLNEVKIPKAIKQTTAKIGEQLWMKHNLNIDRFRNGDIIPHVNNAKEWHKYSLLKKPAWCYHNFDPNNGKLYGKLYNWYAVNDPRGLAPQGWHVPHDYEWSILFNYLRGQFVYGDGSDERVGDKMRSIQGWYIPERKRNPFGSIFKTNNNNISGFSALPGGYLSVGGYNIRNIYGIYFTDIGDTSSWWSCTEWEETFAYAVFLNINGPLSKVHGGRGDGRYVRCVKD